MSVWLFIYYSKKLLAIHVGFEPTREVPNGFQVHLLNHSDNVS